jgi:probable rRNA maturation factor
MSSDNIKEVSFIYELPDFVLENEILAHKWLDTLLTERFKIQAYILNFIFVTKTQILELNTNYLKHEYETDVISFDFSKDFNVFGGDIFICPEVVEKNAEEYGVSFEEEILRVMVHGVLHFMGFSDKTEIDSAEMRSQEDICLELYKK